MNCKNCGCALSEDADICYACGTPVDSPEPPRDSYVLDDPAPAADETEAGDAAQSAALVDNAQKAGKFTRVISFLFALIGLIFYGVQRKNGEEAKAISVADAIMAGLCAKMAVAIFYLLVAFIAQR